MSFKILLTGASGMLGRAIMRECESHPDIAIVAVTRKTTPSSRADRLVWKQLDLADVDATNRLLDETKPEFIVHAAATGMQSPRPSWPELVRANVDLVVSLFDVVCRSSAAHFVHISSGLIYRDCHEAARECDPIGNAHPYGASKAAADLLVHAMGVERRHPLTIIRPFAFTGLGDSGSRLFPSLIAAAAEGRPFAMTSGAQVRDHSAVGDIARGVVLATRRKQSGNAGPEIFNLGSGDETPLGELVRSVVADLGLDVPITFSAREPTPGEPPFSVSDNSRAKAELGWAPAIRLSYAAWQLARVSFPQLKVREPQQKRT